jgi:hypothetical protein
MDTPRLHFWKCWRSARAKEKDAIAASLKPSSRGNSRGRAGRRPPHPTLPTRRGSLAVMLQHTFVKYLARGGSPCVRLAPDAGAEATHAAVQLGTLDTRNSDTPCCLPNPDNRWTENLRNSSTIHTRHTRTWEICALSSTFPYTTILTRKLSTPLPVRNSPASACKILYVRTNQLPVQQPGRGR